MRITTGNSKNSLRKAGGCAMPVGFSLISLAALNVLAIAIVAIVVAPYLGLTNPSSVFR